MRKLDLLILCHSYCEICIRITLSMFAYFLWYQELFGRMDARPILKEAAAVVIMVGSARFYGISHVVMTGVLLVGY